jgi:hypothetical protein
MASAEYRVSVPFRGVDVAQRNAIVTIPNGAILSMAKRQAANTFITVRWGERELFVFERDLSERAVEESLGAPSIAESS